jgi:protein SCO1/2
VRVVASPDSIDPDRRQTTRHAPPSRALQGVLWGVLGLVIVAVVVAALRSQSSDGARLRVYGTVPDFSLIERSGRPLGAADLRGDIWIANFIFTTCPGMCPGLTARMAGLQRHLRAESVRADEVRLVSFSVDPETDTPEVLSGYADRFAAEPGRWFFLTGSRDDVYRLVRDGFRLSVAQVAPVAPGERDAGSEPITHSDRFVLVDPELRIRGYFHGNDEASMAALTEALARLRAEVSP